MNRRIIGFLAVAFIGLVTCLAFLIPARAADPEIQWREAIRAIAGTNGVVNVAIRDTNTTTDVTLRTPAFVGQILFGRAGSSNRTWVATEKTTNGWTQVAP